VGGVAEALARAAAARAAGDVDAARACYIEAFGLARGVGDAEAMATAALNLPSTQRFGVHPGQVPALLHEAYSVAVEPAARCRLAAALARAWVYGGDAERAAVFARRAERLAGEVGDPAVLADALDAALGARWGPDDYAERTRLTVRLTDAAAHQTDPGVRLSAHLWRLTTAWEALDLTAVHRQLRALDLLAAEPAAPRVAFFAASRRAMYALTTGELARADQLIEQTRRLGAELPEPDREAVLHSLVADRALQAGDWDVLRREAAAFEAFGAAEGIPSVAAEAATFWLALGETERAERLALQLAGPGLDTTARDVDFLLTVSCLVQVAAACGLDELTAAGAALLEPYAGRSVINAGAVTFHGVVDDYLHQAYRRLGSSAGGGDAEEWRRRAGSAYRRIGAVWWQRRLAGFHDPGREIPELNSRPAAASNRGPESPAVRVLYLQPGSAGVWTVGPAGATVAVPDLKGLQYLRHLVDRPGQPVAALALSDAVAGHPGAGVAQSDAGELLDGQALAAYRRRLTEIDVARVEADAWADGERLERLDSERQALLDALASATGLGGRPRRAGSTQERARIAVRKAIRAALDRIEQVDPELARLLRDTVHTGASCRYEPDATRPATWITGQPRRAADG